MRLGLTLSSDYEHHSIIAMTKDGSTASKIFEVGDLILRVNGTVCTAPVDTALLLRESYGRIELHVMRGADVDVEAVVAAERDAGVSE